MCDTCDVGLVSLLLGICVVSVIGMRVFPRCIFRSGTNDIEQHVKSQMLLDPQHTKEKSVHDTNRKSTHSHNAGDSSFSFLLSFFVSSSSLTKFSASPTCSNDCM